MSQSPAWEYEVATFNAAPTAGQLASLGADGWELVTVVPTVEIAYPPPRLWPVPLPIWRAYFKRPVAAPPAAR